MSDFQFRTLENIKKAELINVFNSAFANYFVNIELQEKTLADKIMAENIALENSVGAFFENKLAGFILIGIEGKNSYNAGTGVLPKFRGNQLTCKMYEFILPKLKSQNITNQQLEVIAENFPAIKTYEKIGFRKMRTLACFKGKIDISKTNRKIVIKVLDEMDERLFNSFSNSQPSWQNSISAINRTKNQHKIIGAFYEKEPVGYLIYTENGRIKQFAVKKEFRNLGIGKNLFAKLDQKEITITNINKNDSETISFLNKIRLNSFQNQFEMKLTI